MQRSILNITGYLDKHNLIGLREYSVAEWKKYEKNIIKSSYSEAAEEGYLAITGDFLYPVMTSLVNIFEISDSGIVEDRQNFRLEQAIELMPHSALRLNYKVLDENALDKLIEAFLTPIFPDLNSSPSLTLPESYRQPDSAIPSLSLLLEYKFLKNKSEHWT